MCFIAIKVPFFIYLMAAMFINTHNCCLFNNNMSFFELHDCDSREEKCYTIIYLASKRLQIQYVSKCMCTPQSITWTDNNIISRVEIEVNISEPFLPCVFFKVQNEWNYSGADKLNERLYIAYFCVQVRPDSVWTRKHTEEECSDVWPLPKLVFVDQWSQGR